MYESYATHTFALTWISSCYHLQSLEKIVDPALFFLWFKILAIRRRDFRKGWIDKSHQTGYNMGRHLEVREFFCKADTYSMFLRVIIFQNFIETRK